jgi:hypothetical protein
MSIRYTFRQGLSSGSCKFNNQINWIMADVKFAAPSGWLWSCVNNCSRQEQWHDKKNRPAASKTSKRTRKVKDK